MARRSSTINPDGVEGPDALPALPAKQLLRPRANELWKPPRMAAAERNIKAASDFDKAHAQARQVSHSMRQVAKRGDGETRTKRGAFRQSMDRLHWNKYVVPEEGVVLVHKSIRKKAEKEAWTLEKSIWGPRAKSDSRSFWDSDELMRRKFEKDWARLKVRGLHKYIQRVDDGDDDDDDDLDEVDDVAETLWSFYRLVHLIFDFYAAQSSGGGLDSITLNPYADFVRDAKILVEKSSTCSSNHLDMLFIAVNANNKELSAKDKEQGKVADRTLDRCEFTDALVRMAIMKYVQTKEIPDVSTALAHMFEHDIRPNLDVAALLDPNHDTRTARRFYNEEVDSVLRTHENSLRAIFEIYASSGAATGRGGATTKLEATMMSMGEWMAFVKDCCLLDDDVSARECTMCFMRARMKVFDEESARGSVRATQICFEDFLEAFCQAAVLKSFPADAQMAEMAAAEDFEYVDGGHFMLWLMDSYPAEHDALIKGHANTWGEPPTGMAVERSIEHACTMVVRSIKQSNAVGCDDLSDLRVRHNECKRFFKGDKSRKLSEAARPAMARGPATPPARRPKSIKTATNVVRVCTDGSS